MSKWAGLCRPLSLSFGAEFMGERISVLLIEDDIHDVETVQRAFSTVHPPIFDLQHAAKFFDAIQAIKQQPFHVVILDLGLPDSVGLNGVRRLMSLIPTIPVIVLTGMDDDESALEGIALGAQEFLDKNDVTPKRLIRTLRHAIKRKQVALELAKSSKPVGAMSSLDAAQFILQTRQAIADMEVQLDSIQQTELTPTQQAAISRVEASAESIAASAETLLDQMAASTGEEDPAPDGDSDASKGAASEG